MKQAQKKKLAVLLILAMLFSLLPAGAFAAEEGNTVKELDITQGDITITANGYTVGDATTETEFTGSYKITGNSTSTGNSIVVTGGVQNITLENVSISSSGCAFALQNGANVTLNLVEDNTLQSGGMNAGIHVPAGTALTIAGEGNLTARGGTSRNNGGAGIGGDGNTGNFGDITLQGYGIITANGGTRGAGIGGGGHCVQETRTGNITINSGTINAKGGQYGAGIGGDSDNTTSNVKVTITGGTVTATGDYGGAGIGGGFGSAGGTILISGGKITATGS